MRTPSTTASQSTCESRKFGRIAGAANGSGVFAWTVPMDSGRRTHRGDRHPGLPIEGSVLRVREARRGHEVLHVRGLHPFARPHVAGDGRGLCNPDRGRGWRGWRVLSGRDECRILVAHGFAEVRRRGSHVAMQRNDAEGTVTVPVPDHREAAHRYVAVESCASQVCRVQHSRKSRERDCLTSSLQTLSYGLGHRLAGRGAIPATPPCCAPSTRPSR